MYIIASHIAYSKNGSETFGPANNICDFLLDKNKDFIFIKHCLSGHRQSEISSKSGVLRVGKFYNKNIVIGSLEKIVINLKNANKKGVVFIGIDPVNGISGVALKLFKRTKCFIYLTPDYTEVRFKNSVLNKAYHLMDRICLKYADEVWSVSTRIVKKRRLQGVPDSRNKFLPNSPDFNSIKRLGYDGNNKLVIVSPLSKALDFGPVIEIIKKVSRKYSDIKLQVVGSGDEENVFKKMAEQSGVEKNVTFLGWRSHDEVIKIISESFLGFALYTKFASWNRYGDSMKAREYVACGIPVIISDIPSTAEDISGYGAGLVVGEMNDQEVNRVCLFIEKCIDDKSFYNSLRNNALKMGKDFDKNKILSELLKV
jgi:glycosyltransferase involved in cell wall biosynthesis